MIDILSWLENNIVEIFGAAAGIVYVFLEIRQNIWLWPVGIVTSAVYIWVFFTGKLYADMGLQGYYLVISCLGWYWWLRGAGQRAQGEEHRAQGVEHRAKGEGQEERKGEGEKESNKGEVLLVTRLKFKTGAILAVVFVILYFALWYILSAMTDSPVPEVDSFITSLSIVATWMLARRIYDHWYLWIVVNSVATVLFVVRGLYPTVVLYIVYGIMSFAGLAEWKKSLVVSGGKCQTMVPE